MYEDFQSSTLDGEICTELEGTIVAIATPTRRRRHRFDVNGRPCGSHAMHRWVEQKKRTGKVITDQLAAQIADAISSCSSRKATTRSANLHHDS